MRARTSGLKNLPKSLTGIKGFDEITYGGLPKGRPTLVCGSAGSGKSLFAIEFIYNGATRYNEPGVFISFEEAPEELMANVASMGMDLQDLVKKKKLSIDYVHVEKSEIEITGEFDLEGLFIRLGYAIDSIGAKRIVLDTIESLFSGISNHAILRAELRRLFRWIKTKRVTAVITGERGDNSLTRQGLEEYVSDCVILLDQRVTEQYSTRRLRVVKYRGSLHGTNEYPFLIKEKGISVIPISSLTLNHDVSKERISTGVPDLDEMFYGKGIYKGSTVLISGTAGTGKTSLLASFINSVCQRGKKALYISFEESKNQIIRNMSSIGIELEKMEKKGLLEFHITRPTFYSLEMHLALIQEIVKEQHPDALVIDPITSFSNISSQSQTISLLTRLIDFLKMKQITTMMSSLTDSDSPVETTEVNISSLVDTWILLRALENNGERNRALYILKSRGMNHSNQVREFMLTSEGIKLVDIYMGKEGVLIGSARNTHVQLEETIRKQKAEDGKLLKIKLNKLDQITNAQIEALKIEYEEKAAELRNSFNNRLRDEITVVNSLKNDAKSRQKKSQIKQKRENGR